MFHHNLRGTKEYKRKQVALVSVVVARVVDTRKR